MEENISEKQFHQIIKRILPIYYDKEGKPISITYDEEGKPISATLNWARRFEDKEYQIVQQDTLWWGGWLSTVWLGLDHSFGGEKPLIFESMLFFGKGNRNDIECKRYSTLEEAIEGHRQLKQHWSNPLNVPLKILWKVLLRRK